MRFQSNFCIESKLVLSGHITIKPQTKTHNAHDDKQSAEITAKDPREDCDLPTKEPPHSMCGKDTEHPYSETDSETIDSSEIDPSLRGSVDEQDEEHLEEIVLEKPPKLVRHRRAFFNPGGRSHLWPNGEYIYVFDQNIHPTPKSLLLKAFKEIGEKVPCIKFMPADENSNHFIIHTSHNIAQCSSDTLGYMPDVQALVNVGEYCDYALVMHEVFHVLGAIHTQNRPDRDSFVEINWDNIDPARANNFERKEGEIRITDNEYDYKSAMHYPANAFNFKDRNVPTIRALDSTVKLKNYGHYELDEQDYESLRNWYGCGTGSSSMSSSSTINKTESETEEKLDDTSRKSSRRSWDPDCVIGPWSEWSDCEDGYKSKQRYVEVPLGQGGDPQACPKRLKQRRCRPKRRRYRSIDPTPYPQGSDVFDEDSGKAVTHMKKTVQVVEGQPIVLAVGNPNNFPVKWYKVVGERDVEVSPDEYKIFRSTAGNNQLVVGESSVKDNDGQIFVTKISLEKSILRVAWNVEVLCEDEYFDNSTE